MKKPKCRAGHCKEICAPSPWLGVELAAGRAHPHTLIQCRRDLILPNYEGFHRVPTARPKETLKPVYTAEGGAEICLQTRPAISRRHRRWAVSLVQEAEFAPTTALVLGHQATARRQQLG